MCWYEGLKADLAAYQYDVVHILPALGLVKPGSASLVAAGFPRGKRPKMDNWDNKEDKTATTTLS